MLSFRSDEEFFEVMLAAMDSGMRRISMWDTLPMDLQCLSSPRPDEAPHGGSSRRPRTVLYQHHAVFDVDLCCRSVYLYLSSATVVTCVVVAVVVVVDVVVFVVLAAAAVVAVAADASVTITTFKILFDSSSKHSDFSIPSHGLLHPLPYFSVYCINPSVSLHLYITGSFILSIPALPPTPSSFVLPFKMSPSLRPHI